jgi:ATP-dependent protease ClpP protease subunit
MAKPKSVLRPKEAAVQAKKRPSLDREKFFLTQMFTRGLSIQDRVITLTGPIAEGGSLFSWFDACMNVLERRSRQSITVRIQSPGGVVYDALAIVGRIKSSKCHVVTEAYGEVMSAATLILASGDRRRISRYAWFMHHEGSYAQFGRTSEHEARLQQEKREEKVWARWMAELSKRDEQYWLESGRHVDLYLTADEAVEVGVADEVIG